MSRSFVAGSALLTSLVLSDCTSSNGGAAGREPTQARQPARSGAADETRGLGGFRIVGYCQPQTAATVDLRELTHVFYAFARPHADGSVTLPGSPEVLERLVERAHAQQVAVSLSVGGWMEGDDSAFHTLAASASTRVRFARELAEVTQRFGLDGIDVDWEFPEAHVAADYTQLMATLAEALGRDAWLTAAVGAHEHSTAGVTSDVMPYLSFVAVMAYDDDQGAHHAPLTLAEDALSLWRNKGVPAHKIVLGVPLYSRPHFLPFWEIVQRDPGNADRDELRGETYNGRPTIVAKTRLALERAGGIMIWELGQDARGEHSLVRTIAHTVRMDATRGR